MIQKENRSYMKLLTRFLEEITEKLVLTFTKAETPTAGISKTGQLALQQYGWIKSTTCQLQLISIFDSGVNALLLLAPLVTIHDKDNHMVS